MRHSVIRAWRGARQGKALRRDLVAFTFLITAIANSAYADDLPEIFVVSGFATLGVTHSSLDTADFVSAAFQPSGAGFSHRWDFAGETKFGFQLTAHLTNQLTALVQVVSSYNYDNTFTPTIEWANVNYAFTPDLNVRVGRIESPTLLDSDHREVGYSTPWLREPQEVYGIESITNSDGVDTSYRSHIGHIGNTVHLMYGYSSLHVNPGALKINASDIVGLFDTLEYDDLTVHAGYLHTRISTPFLRLSTAALYNVGVSYDASKWFVQAEMARVTADGSSPGYLAGYATAGIRISKFTPYMTYSQGGSLGHPTVVPNYNRGQSDLSAGVRWDFARNFDMKVQFEHIWMPSDSAGLLINEQPDFRFGSCLNVLSATLDFVF